MGANGEGAEGRHALVALGGQTLLDVQVRMLAAIGAAPIVVYSEGPHLGVETRVSRLRADGLDVVHVEDSRGAAALIDPSDRVLVVGDAILAAPDPLAALAAAPRPTVLAIPDAPESERYERIDLEWRWAGLALASGEQVRSTAAMAGDWDLVSTLLRRMVQARSPVVPVEAPDRPPLLVQCAADRAPHEAEQAAAARANRPDMVARALAPLERWAVGRLVGTAIPAAAFTAMALLLLQAAIAAILLGWPRLAAIPLFLALPLPQIDRQLCARRMQAMPPLRRALVDAFALALVVLFAVPAAASGGWLVVPLLVSSVLFILLSDEERRRRPAGTPYRLFVTHAYSRILIVGIALAAGEALWGMVVIFAHAAFSFLFLYAGEEGIRSLNLKSLPTAE